jgi:hypothetical protein
LFLLDLTDESIMFRLFQNDTSLDSSLLFSCGLDLLFQKLLFRFKLLSHLLCRGPTLFILQTKEIKSTSELLQFGGHGVHFFVDKE